MYFEYEGEVKNRAPATQPAALLRLSFAAMVLGDDWRPKFAIADLNVVVLHYAGVQAYVHRSLQDECIIFSSLSQEVFACCDLTLLRLRSESAIIS